jgi:hypothetical protein
MAFCIAYSTAPTACKQVCRTTKKKDSITVITEPGVTPPYLGTSLSWKVARKQGRRAEQAEQLRTV